MKVQKCPKPKHTQALAKLITLMILVVCNTIVAMRARYSILYLLQHSTKTSCLMFHQLGKNKKQTSVSMLFSNLVIGVHSFHGAIL